MKQLLRVSEANEVPIDNHIYILLLIGTLMANLDFTIYLLNLNTKD